MASGSSILSISCLYSEQETQQSSDLLFCSNCMKRGKMEGRKEGVEREKGGKNSGKREEEKEG